MLAPLSNSFFSEVKLAVKSNLDRCQHLLNVSWKVSKLDTKVRVLGSLGFRKLVFKIYYYIPRVRLGLTQRLWWWWEWLRSCPSKRGSFWPVLHFILFFQKGIDEGPPHLRIMAFSYIFSAKLFFAEKSLTADIDFMCCKKAVVFKHLSWQIWQTMAQQQLARTLNYGNFRLIWKIMGFFLKKML